jgi:hypothetical protein
MHDFAVILGLSGLVLGFMGLEKPRDALPILDSPTFQAITIAGGDYEKFGDSTICFSKIIQANNFFVNLKPGLHHFQAPWLEGGIVSLKVDQGIETPNISCMSWEAKQ